MTVSLVCIGGSAGAIPAIEKILRSLSPTFSAPVVVLLHRKASHPDSLVTTLAGWTPLEVRPIEDSSEITPGVIHVAPGGYHCLIGDDTFVLTLEPPEHFCIPSIDALFSSAAARFGSEVVAVALSCANDDGTVGAVQVHEAGGKVVIQASDDAPHPVLVNAIEELIVPNAVAGASFLGPLLNDFVRMT